ncbi:SpoIIE family protein phosphatase [Flammeovirga agarivorans]|uniref:SpoIIE family protein phosphatase n=1 Tax=Flammeovirga agarivorans TaxID=2726742 RepID=A0A7X8SHJ6_9BACT|nr:SpoIIE family protein phosphatase [Flammeovirga agarivorans]NLR90314.1 SpoIIE family protein phosphatase [Flammeovirga agarivorans]
MGNTLHFRTNTSILILLFFIINSVYAHQQQSDEQLNLMNDDTEKVTFLTSTALMEQKKNPHHQSKPLMLANKAIKLARKINDENALLQAYNTKAILFREFSTFDQAIDYHKKAIIIAEKNLEEARKIELYLDLGATYRASHNFVEAKDIFTKAQELSHTLKMWEYEGISLINIGFMYLDLDEPKSAQHFFMEAEKLSSEHQLTDLYIIATIGIGKTYIPSNTNSERKKAKKYFSAAIKSSQKRKKQFFEGISNIDLGRIYLKENKMTYAYNYFVKAVKQLKPYKEKEYLSGEYRSLDDPLNFNRYYAEAISYQNSLKYYRGEISLSQYNQAVKEELELFGNPDQEELEHLRNALSELKQHYSFLDSINQLDEEEAARLLKDYLDRQKEKLKNLEDDKSYLRHLLIETEKIATEKIVMLEQKNQLQEALISKQNWIGISLVLLVIFIGTIGGYQYKIVNDKKKVNRALSQQNEKISEQNVEIKTTADQLQNALSTLQIQNKKTNESILAGWRIQNAMLPANQQLDDIIPQHFVLYKPRDIVSGDFYWVGKEKEHTIIAAIDCTGHGIPGAFMSMLGNALLNQVINVEGAISPDKILTKLDQYIAETLHQGLNNDSREGMDIALCVISPDQQSLQYAGAKNPLVLVRDRQPMIYKGVNRHVGGNRSSKKMIGFNKHEITIEPGDMFYIYSDGYQDQFGGPDNKKFMRKHLIAEFCEIAHLSLNEQNTHLDDTFEHWKKDKKQIDDVLVMGFKIS